MAHLVTFRSVGKKYFAKIDGGAEFQIGTKVTYQQTLVGLMNTNGAMGSRYDPANFAGHGFWAEFIHPTAVCESGGLFHCLNTYDRARFTFTFLQFAAHVPNGDFVRFFRRLLALPAGPDYFPDLVVKDGRICRETETGLVQLEDAESTERLMDYLNPSPTAIEPVEVVNAAKFVGWSLTDPQHREVQVQTGIDLVRANMRIYAKRYNLDGARDTICAAVADIRHQGRADSTQIIAALGAPKPLEALLKLGARSFPQRCKALAEQINAKIQAGVFDRRSYDLASGEFK